MHGENSSLPEQFLACFSPPPQSLSSLSVATQKAIVCSGLCWELGQAWQKVVAEGGRGSVGRANGRVQRQRPQQHGCCLGDERTEGSILLIQSERSVPAVQQDCSRTGTCYAVSAHLNVLSHPPPLLPCSANTPISSPWIHAWRRITITTGMRVWSDFSSAPVETEPSLLTGYQKSPAGRKGSPAVCLQGDLYHPVTSVHFIITVASARVWSRSLWLLSIIGRM